MTDATKLIEGEEYQKLLKLYPELDFTQALSDNPAIAEYLKMVIGKEAMQATDPLLSANAPKLDDDLSMYFIINNLPKCKEDKVAKLITLITKTLG
jgi:hypothetical protein